MSTDVQVTTQGKVGTHIYETNNLADLPEYWGNLFPGALAKPLGSTTPIYAKGTEPDEFEIVGEEVGPPELGKLPLSSKLPPGAETLLEEWELLRCPLVGLIKIDECGDADDLSSWQSVIVAEMTKLENIDTSDLSAANESKEITVSGSGIVWKSGRVYPFLWGETADATVLAEVVDVMFCGSRSCGNCGKPKKQCNDRYALSRENTGSPGLGAQLIYSTDQGSTWATDDINTLGGLGARRFACAGNYILVVSEAVDAIHYALKSTLNWLTTTAGFVTGMSPRCIYVESVRNVLIGAQGGYIYQSTDFTAGVTPVADGSATPQNMNDIHGYGKVVVAVGDSNAILYSINSGKTFGLIVGPRVGINLNWVWCLSEYRWYVGANDGTLWYTQDQGANWAPRVLPDQANILSILDGAFGGTKRGESQQVGALSVQKTNLTGTVYRTISGGREWYQDDSVAIKNLPDNERITAVAVCGYNQLLGGGKVIGSTDGILVQAKE